jgi:hypothetical protein
VFSEMLKTKTLIEVRNFMSKLLIDATSNDRSLFKEKSSILFFRDEPKLRDKIPQLNSMKKRAFLISPVKMQEQFDSSNYIFA